MTDIETNVPEEPKMLFPELIEKDKQERLQRAGQAIQEICKAERVVLRINQTIQLEVMP